MNIMSIINFLTTEDVEILNMGDHYIASVNKINQSRGNYPLEAICNCYTKWKNTKQPLEAGMNDLSQL